MKNRNCSDCPYVVRVTAQDGFRFLACRHVPYMGRWIATIEKCPMANTNKEGEQNDKDD